jgi:hypothetical protein
VKEKGKVVFCNLLQMGVGGFSPMFPANETVGGDGVHSLSSGLEKVIRPIISI